MTIRHTTPDEVIQAQTIKLEEYAVTIECLRAEIEQLRRPTVVEVQQSATDLATLAVTGALDLIEGAMIEVANRRAWGMLALLESARERLAFTQQMVQKETE